MADFQEDVLLSGFSGAESGPVIHRNVKEGLFSINFAGVKTSFIRDSLQLKGVAKSRGEAARKLMHERLDEFMCEWEEYHG